MSQWTYIIESGPGGPVKIGMTRDEPALRLATFQIGNPVRLRLVAVVEGDVERSLQWRFRRDRIHGEWFTRSPRMCRLISLGGDGIRRYAEMFRRAELASVIREEREARAAKAEMRARRAMEGAA